MDVTRVMGLLEAAKEKRIVVIGDLMLDRFIWGEVSRISPEAPVPVVHVERESAYPGGAANVVRNLLPFSSNATVAGVTGSGPEGAMLLEAYRAAGIDTTHIMPSNEVQTIVKTRVVARGQQVVRIDHERVAAISEALAGKITSVLLTLASEADGIIFEDYGKGLLSQRMVDRVTAAAREKSACITVDPNPHNPLAWPGATLVKPNRTEALHVAGVRDDSMDWNDMEMVSHLADKLRSKWGCEAILMTMGEEGMLLCEETAGATVRQTPSRAREVFDVSGAGDTAIAILTMALCAGASLGEAVELANHASGVVVGKVGTATLTSEELLQAVRRSL